MGNVDKIMTNGTKIIIQAVTGRLATVCGSIAQSEKLVCKARKKGLSTSYTRVSAAPVTDVKSEVVYDIRVKAV